MKLLAALLLIGVTSAPAFAGGPRVRRPMDIGLKVDMLNKKSVSVESIEKNIFQAL